MNKYACAIGSLPFIAPDEAVDYVLNEFRGIPFWPQLPKRTFLENMYVQYSEAFPARVIDLDRGHIHFETKTRLDELAEFYDHVLAKDLDYFSISKEYAAGLHAMLKKLDGKKLPGLKGHITGGVSYSLFVSDEKEKLLAFDENFFDVSVKGCLLKGLWQIKQLAPFTDDLIIFSDEPGIAGFGSAFVPVEEKQIRQALEYYVPKLQESGVKVGMHCCANTQWSIIIDSGIDILSFDAFSYFDNLVLYSDSLKAFLRKGGIIAYGIVPTDEQVFSLAPSELLKMLTSHIDELAKLGIDKQTLAAQSMITPACGLGTKSVELAKQALKLVGDTADQFCNHYGLK